MKFVSVCVCVFIVFFFNSCCCWVTVILCRADGEFYVGVGVSQL